MDTKIRELLHEMAGEMPSQGDVPARVRSRVRRRAATSVASLLVAVTVAVGAVLGVRTLMRSDVPVPGRTGPTPPPSASVLSASVVFDQGNHRPLGGEQVYLQSPDGSIRQLTKTAHANNEPEAWAPDGSGIVVQRAARDRGPDLYLIHLDGSAETRLTDGRVWTGDARFSPDGSHLAFLSGDHFAIEVMAADGSGRRRLVAASGSPDSTEYSWSPDGSRIAFAAGSGQYASVNGDIYVVSLDGAVTRLTHPEHFVCLQGVPRECGSDEGPVWSPDGSTIAFVRVTMQPPGGTDRQDRAVWTMNSDGSGVRRLTGPGAPTGCSAPAWSPDGTKIAVTCADGVFVVNREGGSFVRVAPAGWFGATWSPDGTQIAVSKGYRSLFVVDADGSGARRITIGNGLEVSLPLWRP